MDWIGDQPKRKCDLEDGKNLYTEYWIYKYCDRHICEKCQDSNFKDKEKRECITSKAYKSIEVEGTTTYDQLKLKIIAILEDIKEEDTDKQEQDRRLCALSPRKTVGIASWKTNNTPVKKD